MPYADNFCQQAKQLFLVLVRAFLSGPAELKSVWMGRTMEKPLQGTEKKPAFPVRDKLWL